MLRESLNNVYIKGRLKSVRIQEDTNKNNKPVVRGMVMVEVKQKVSGKEEIESIPVQFYVGRFKDDGSPNKGYDSVMNVQNMKRISTDGADADHVAMTLARLTEWAGYDNSGTPFSRLNISNIFYNVANPSEPDAAVFQLEFFIRSIEEELVGGEPSGRLMIKGLTVRYGGVVDMLTLYVESPKGVEFISDNWNIGDTVIAEGRIRRTPKVSPVAVSNDDDNGFSDDEEGVSSHFSSSGNYAYELIITKANRPEDENRAYDEDEMRAGMTERMNRIEASRKPAAPKARQRNW